jgi:hypothetical protein
VSCLYHIHWLLFLYCNICHATLPAVELHLLDSQFFICCNVIHAYCIILTALKLEQNPSFSGRGCHMLQVMRYFDLPDVRLERFCCNIARSLCCALMDMKDACQYKCVACLYLRINTVVFEQSSSTTKNWGRSWVGRILIFDWNCCLQFWVWQCCIGNYDGLMETSKTGRLTPSLCLCISKTEIFNVLYIYIYSILYIKGVTGGTDQTLAGCSLC